MKLIEDNSLFTTLQKNSSSKTANNILATKIQIERNKI